jgi:hypothetical protein
MDDEEIETVKKHYEENVRWLRDHVAPDDIYDFAQQTLMAAEYCILQLHRLCDVVAQMEKDNALKHWIGNITCINELKKSNYGGIIDVSLKEDL